MRHLLLALAAILLLASAAGAQERGQAGIAFGTNGIGVVFQVHDRVAVRFDGSFSTTTASTDIDLTTWSIGFSAPIYLQRWDALRTYVVPRFVYGRTSPGSSNLYLNESSNHEVDGSFGAQYALHRRFAVYGEVGIAYHHSGSITNVLGTSVDSSISGTSSRGAIGAILYFN